MLVLVGAGAAFLLASGRRMPPAPQLAFELIAAATAAGYLFRTLEVLLREGVPQLGPEGDPIQVGAAEASTGYLLYAAALGLVLLGVAVAGPARIPVRSGPRPLRVAGYRILVGVAVVGVVPALMMPWHGIDYGALDPDGPSAGDVDAWWLVFLVAALVGLAMVGATAWLPAYVRRFRLIGLAAAVAALVFLVMGHEWLLADEPRAVDYDELTPDSGLRAGLGASAALALAFVLLPPGPARRQSVAVSGAVSGAAQT